MIESVLTPFAPTLVESTRSIGYSFESAIADIIDNSISAKAKNIEMDFSAYNSPYLSIFDDGIGMTGEDLFAAMRYGSKNPKEIRDETDLGRFGLGLKMASLSQCRKLTVVTKRNDVISACRWDLDIIYDRKDWILLTFEEKEMKELPQFDKIVNCKTGTLVIWQDFDKLIDQSSNDIEKIFDEKIDTTRNHLALVFHRFLENDNGKKEIVIKMNNFLVTARDPFLKNHPSTQPLTDQKLTIEGEKILIKGFILPYMAKLKLEDFKLLGGKEDLKRNQGFYIYRNKRLIMFGTWFGLGRHEELTKLSRIRVDVPNSLDHIWGVDVKKSCVTLPLSVRKSLINTISDVADKSKKVHMSRGKRLNDSEIIHIWDQFKSNEGVKYSINRKHPIIESLFEGLAVDQIKKIETYLDLLEDNFPYQNVYLDIAGGGRIIEEHEDEKDTAFNIGMEMAKVANLMTGGMGSFFRQLPSQEPFTKYPDVIERLMRELKYNG